MTLEEKINDQIATDDETILESNFGRVEKLFDLHQDGAINIENKYRKLDLKLQVLIYFIGQRFAYEGKLVEDDILTSSFFYDRIDKSDRTVRNYLQDLREAGFITKEGQNEHRLLAENLPRALDRVEEAVEEE